jgi:hypothetical protein
MQPAGDCPGIRVEHACQIRLIQLHALAGMPKSICQVCRQLRLPFVVCFAS